MCVKVKLIKKNRLVYRIIRNRHVQIIGVVLFHLALTLGCRHTSTLDTSTSSRPQNNDLQPVNNPNELTILSSIDDVLQNPDPHINKNVTIMGMVNDLKLKKSRKGYRVLAFDLRDKDKLITTTEKKEHIVRLNLLEQLDAVCSKLVKSAQEIEVSSLDATVFQDLSYDLRISGNRIRALSNLFRSKEMFEIGNDIELVANGYLKLGDAIHSFSNLVGPSEPEFALEQVNVHSNSSVDVSTTDAASFQDLAKSVCLELSTIADILIENRSKLVEGKLMLSHNNVRDNNGYSLLSMGDMFEAKRWESKKNDAEISEHQFDILSKGFTLVGEGINDVYKGIRSLSSQLTVKIEPAVPEVVGFPTLKCAYIGYNKFVLTDCEKKVKQLGNDDVITVKGRLIRGNLHEQLNLLWLKMESVTIDDLTINLAYNDSSTTWRNISNFYEWIKETTN